MSQSKAAYTTMDCESLVFEKNNNMAMIVELIYIVAMVNIAAGLQLRSGKIWMGDLGATVPPTEKNVYLFFAHNNVPRSSIRIFFTLGASDLQLL